MLYDIEYMKNEVEVINQHISSIDNMLTYLVNVKFDMILQLEDGREISNSYNEIAKHLIDCKKFYLQVKKQLEDELWIVETELGRLV